jgi:hypothetical protein
VDALRLIVYDRTCAGRGILPGLSGAWQVGARLYTSLGRVDSSKPVASWEEALDWLASYETGRSLAEVQFWGHGKWGEARIGGECLDVRWLASRHPQHDRLLRVRDRFQCGARSLWWFRTCETLGAVRGQEFAVAWSEFLRASVAGHTYVIGYWQSGLHLLTPGAVPNWQADEGLVEGSPERPIRARWSTSGAPNTITCLHGRVPAEFWTSGRGD